jgi:hypothetical protein
MSSRISSPDDLTALLEAFRPQHAGTKVASEVTQAQVDSTLARIASLTEALRGAEPNETSRLAERLLLADLAFVAAQLRGQSNTLRQLLIRVSGGPSDGATES